MSIFENLRDVQAQVAAAATRSGRNPAGVELVAVTKYASSEAMAEIIKSGLVRWVGESRIQDAVRKKAQFASAPVQWRMIGHLQTNKAAKALEIFDAIDSLDSLKLAETLENLCAKSGRKLPVLVQVKLSDKESQYGIQPEGLEDFLNQCRNLKHLEIQGMMVIGPMTDPVEAVRPHFRRAKQLWDRFFGPTGASSKILSMGMSRDFEIAIEEGATMIRLGSQLMPTNGG